MDSKDKTEHEEPNLQRILENQRIEYEKSLDKVLNDRLSTVTQQVSFDLDRVARELKTEFHELQSKTHRLEQTVATSVDDISKIKHYVTQLEVKLKQTIATLDEKTEKLEIFIRRDNLRFFNVPRLSSTGSHEKCVKSVLSVLEGSVTGKTCTPDDIIRAQRLGRYNDSDGGPPPMMVKFARWSDRMSVLSEGRVALRKRNVTVAADLTDRQRETVQQYRRQSFHAYYRGDRLVVEEQNQQRYPRPAWRRGLVSHDTRYRNSSHAGNNYSDYRGIKYVGDSSNDSRYFWRNDRRLHCDDTRIENHASSVDRDSASWMGRERPTTHHKDDCDFPDQPRTSKSETQRRKSAPEYACNMFRTWSAAAVWIMMALTVATSSLAGAVCIGTEVKLDKGEAVLRCPLPVNVSATRQGIIVKHFPTPDPSDMVLFCDWPEEADKPECESSDGFSLVGQLTDQVVAKVPVSRLMVSGTYKCQLYPPDYQRPFTPCHIHHFSDSDEDSAVVPTPVISSIATNSSTPGQDPLIREAPPCVGQSGSVALTAVVLVLQVITIILLVVNVLYLQNRQNLHGIMDGKRVAQAHHKDDCDFPDQPRTSNPKTKRRKSAPEYACNMLGTWSAAAVWIMMVLTVATSSLAVAECIGTEVKLDKGEAVLRCPLPVDVSATHRGIIVKHFPTPDSADEVLFCYWPEEADKPECESRDSFSLQGQLTDQVVAKVPVSRLMVSGDYQCQLYPPDYQRPFTPCHIYHFNDSDEGSAVVATPVISSIATNSCTPGQDPLDREAPPCVRQSGSVALTAAVLVLQVIIIILLVGNVLNSQSRKNLQKPVTSEREPMNSLDEAGRIYLRPREKLQPCRGRGACGISA